MRLRILISLSALLPSLLQTVWAQSADDLFHGGAQFYLSNNIPGALEQVENGLKLYPDDVKLKKLDELLKRQNQDQKQNQNQQKDQQKDQKKAEQKQSEPQQAKPSAGEEKNPSKPDQDQKQGQASAAGEMTPQEAQRLLDSQKDDELMLPVSRKDKPTGSQRPIRDW
jgi:hypothetical protein